MYIYIFNFPKSLFWMFEKYFVSNNHLNIYQIQPNFLKIKCFYNHNTDQEEILQSKQKLT